MKLGFFTRLLDDAAPAQRYRLATEQIVRAEELGFDGAAVAQHHFHGTEGGLPSPLVFLANVAAKTSRIRLTTGVITLPHEDPVRTAEDAAVLWQLSGGRVEIGFAAGGTPASFVPFGKDFADRRELFAANLDRFEAALAGADLGGGNALYPPTPELAGHVWLATFSAPLAIEAARRGHGLMLSRTQPRPEGLSLADVQQPLIDAYLEHLPAGVEPRISVARTVVVTDTDARGLELAETGLRRLDAATPLPELIEATDTHVGSPDRVAEELAADAALARATHASFQVHSVDPGHEDVLASIELLATRVAPALNWTDAPAPAR